AVPVVPCHLTGAWEALPPGKSLPRPRKISLRIGRPLDFSHLSKNRDDCRTIAADTEAAVRALATDSSA
ncbi:MAG: 1-acyl-sn-glycerol-3-phosphate acyltransferase, partial [Akkermansiaceae bacterium]|nr:1-acyl-sn-glycerol-3-phosphate acyltransferase [Akkermansiaceae bacterium]